MKASKQKGKDFMHFMFSNETAERTRTDTMKIEKSCDSGAFCHIAISDGISEHTRAALTKDRCIPS